MDIIQASEINIEDVRSLCKIVSQNMTNNVIDQWDDVYPNKKVFLDDIRDKRYTLFLIIIQRK